MLDGPRKRGRKCLCLLRLKVPDASCGVQERMLALASEDLSLRPGSASVVSVTLIKLLNFSESQGFHPEAE